MWLQFCCVAIVCNFSDWQHSRSAPAQAPRWDRQLPLPSACHPLYQCAYELVCVCACVHEMTEYLCLCFRKAVGANTICNICRFTRISIYSHVKVLAVCFYVSVKSNQKWRYALRNAFFLKFTLGGNSKIYSSREIYIQNCYSFNKIKLLLFEIILLIILQPTGLDPDSGVWTLNIILQKIKTLFFEYSLLAEQVRAYDFLCWSVFNKNPSTLAKW